MSLLQMRNFCMSGFPLFCFFLVDSQKANLRFFQTTIFFLKMLDMVFQNFLILISVAICYFVLKADLLYLFLPFCFNKIKFQIRLLVSPNNYFAAINLWRRILEVCTTILFMESFKPELASTILFILSSKSEYWHIHSYYAVVNFHRVSVWGRGFHCCTCWRFLVEILDSGMPFVKNCSFILLFFFCSKHTYLSNFL